MYTCTVYWYIGTDVPCKYLFKGDSFSCGRLQAKLTKEEFGVRCGGPSKAYYLAISPNKTTFVTGSSFYQVFMYIMLCLISC